MVIVDKYMCEDGQRQGVFRSYAGEETGELWNGGRIG